ncbi:MAG: hypothetical protein JW939_06410 [Candidatus Thermoplasmatota archaeon]|nr:hypothetical protein [Candidatus Thermoplasmatota archaeon]
MEDTKDEGVKISLPVQRSKISSVEEGIARVHSSHMDMFSDQETGMVVIRNGKKRTVVKIVGDRFAPANMIILRAGDMERLDVNEGDKVDIEPYQKLSGELKETWQKFVSRFKKKDKEEDKEGD